MLPYQPAWVTIPLGAFELGALDGDHHGFGLHAPLLPALALFGAGWLAAVIFAQAGLPLLRLGYAEDGGELGRAEASPLLRSSSRSAAGRDLRRPAPAGRST